MGGVVFQFFGMLSVHVFRACRSIHAKFTKAADFDAALAYFRSVVQKDTTEPLGASVPLTAVVPTAAIVDPNGKGEADDVMNEDTVAPADAGVEHQHSTGSWEPVTHIRHRVKKICAFVNVGDDGLPRFRCQVYNTSQLNKGMHLFLARTHRPFIVRVHHRERTFVAISGFVPGGELVRTSLLSCTTPEAFVDTRCCAPATSLTPRPPFRTKTNNVDPHRGGKRPPAKHGQEIQCQ